MASEEYYGNTKHPIHGNGSQSPYPPYQPNSPYQPNAATTPVAGPDTGYAPQSGYQAPNPDYYYGGYKQSPPPSYYQQPQQPQYPPYPNQCPNAYKYPPQSQLAYPQDAPPEARVPSSSDRGALGALAGGAAGAYAGHQVHHGLLGTIGGAIAGSLAEDTIKHTNKPDEKKEMKEKKSRKWGFHRHDSSSSSSSSDSEKEKEEEKKKKPSPRGNFSASSNDISLQGNQDLVASCCSISGRWNKSRLPLNSVLTNDFGRFKWKRGGNFGASARNARLIEGGRVLEAELADGKGEWRRDWVRLDERVSNRDGELLFLDES
ncbi:CVNH domain-containing protein [Aspergillus spectabilis]